MKTFCILSFLCYFLSLSLCDPIPIFGTGLKNDGTLAAFGSVDLHWTFTLNQFNPGQTSAFVGNPRPASWAPNTAHSQWIGPATDLTGEFGALNVFVYQTLFSLFGLDPATAQLTLTVEADDVFEVFLNGFSVGSCSPLCYTAPTTLIITSHFVAGQNNLTIRVVNNPAGPTGLQVAATGTATQDIGRVICQNANANDWGFGQGYYCLPGNQFLQCWGDLPNRRFASQPCALGTNCACFLGIECSNHGTESPCR